MSGTALFVAGAAASGKTTLAAATARRLHAALLDLDVLTGPLVEVLGELSGAGPVPGHPGMARHARTARYDALLETALDNARIGTPTVLVAPFTTERADPQAWKDLAERFRELKVEPRLVWVDCPPQLILTRMRQRGAVRDRYTLAMPEQVRNAAGVAPESPHIRVDATLPIAEQLAQLGLSGPSGGKATCGEAP